MPACGLPERSECGGSPSSLECYCLHESVESYLIYATEGWILGSEGDKEAVGETDGWTEQRVLSRQTVRMGGLLARIQPELQGPLAPSSVRNLRQRHQSDSCGLDLQHQREGLRRRVTGPVLNVTLIRENAPVMGRIGALTEGVGGMVLPAAARRGTVGRACRGVGMGSGPHDLRCRPYPVATRV